MTLTGELSWQRLRRSAVDFYSKTKKSLFEAEPPFRALRGNVRIIYGSLESPWSTLYSSQLNFYRYLLRLRRYKRKLVEVGVFRRGWVTLSADFRGKGASLTNHCWSQKTRVIAVSCGIKISAAHNLVLSHYSHLTDRRTDRQNCDSNTGRCITCSRTVKTKKSLFEPPFRGFRGNVRTPFMARWKAHGRLYIRRNWTFFRYLLYGWDVISGNRSKSSFFERRWVTSSTDFRGKGASPTNRCWCQKARVIAVSCSVKIFAAHHLVLSQYTRLTDRRTDRQNCDSNTVRCITCSRTVKTRDVSAKTAYIWGSVGAFSPSIGAI